MKSIKITYWIATGILTVIMLMSAWNYIFNHAFVIEAFTALGYPIYLIYPFAILKLLGLTTILFLKNKPLKEWAYAGFFFSVSLGLLAHLMVNDGQFAFALVALIAIVVSYGTGKKLKKV